MNDDIKAAHSRIEPTVNQDELIIQQQRQIEKEISEKTPPVGNLENFASLLDEYSGDQVYSEKVKYLSSRYRSMRRTRPDGNCFYRAFIFAFLEHLLNRHEECNDFYTLALNSKDKLVNLGFPQFTIEDFHENFMDVVKRIVKGQNTLSSDDLQSIFNEPDVSDYIVVYLRIITSGQLQQYADFYQGFIEGDRTVADFCHQEVEPMYRESDHIHIIALSTALNVGVRVLYMDRGGSEEVKAHDFLEDRVPSIHLLYRPGHYDILYPI